MGTLPSGVDAIVDYCSAVDGRDAAAVADLFCEDGRVDLMVGPANGRDEIREIFEAVFADSDVETVHAIADPVAVPATTPDPAEADHGADSGHGTDSDHSTDPDHDVDLSDVADPDERHVSATFLVWIDTANSPTQVGRGRYDVRLRPDGGRWRIAELDVTLDAPIVPVAAG